MKNLMIILFAFFLSLPVFAQAPQAFNYQGVARDASGNPLIDQDIGLRITIFRDLFGATEVYKEIHLVTTSDLGLFTLKIGTGSVVTGVFADIVWGGEPHFIQIEMDENGGSDYELLGLSQLLSVPYALYAENGSQWEDFEGIVSGDTLSGIRFEERTSRFEFLNQSEEIGIKFPHFKMTESYENGLQASVSMNLIDREQYNDEPTLEFAFSGWQGSARNFSWRASGQSKMFLKGDGKLGLGTTEPKAKIHVTNGDIFIEDITKGVIMKSPNGQCWRVTVDNSGSFASTAVACPN